MLRNLIFILILSLGNLSVVHAEDSKFADLYPRHFLNSVAFGTAVGFICGVAIGHGDPSTYRMTSFGLYGGILLGLYVVHRENEEEQLKFRQLQQVPGSDQGSLGDTHEISFSFNF